MNPRCRVNSDACRLKFGEDQNRSLQDKMRGKTEMQKWRVIWSVLFHESDQDNIPLPSKSGQGNDQYVRCEADTIQMLPKICPRSRKMS